MTMHVMIIGGSKVGTYLAQILIADGHTVNVIESIREDFERARDQWLHPALAGQHDHGLLFLCRWDCDSPSALLGYRSVKVRK